MSTILVVDDQPMVRRLLAHLFSAEGYEVVEAEDGRWALEALGGTTPPDVCILDVMMPALDGWEVLRRIRSDPETQDLPVVMLTARGQAQDRLRAWRLGCDAFIPKPFDPPDCLEEVRAVLARSPEERLGLRERQRAVAEGLTSRSGRRRAG